MNVQLCKQIWDSVYWEYTEGYCVGERGLQPEIFHQIRQSLPNSSFIVVEPTWPKEPGIRSAYKPDLVVVRNGEISEIFELKFMPHYKPQYKNDIQKLIEYVQNQEIEKLVQLNENSGKWKNPLPLSDDVHLHFVAIGQHNASAVLPNYDEPVASLIRRRGVNINHWYGPVGKNNVNWGINFVGAAEIN